MFRRRRSTKERMDPKLVVLLQHPSRYPGDRMQGVVIVDLPTPASLLALEVRLVGEERATLGGLLVTNKNPEARKTLYYEQYITLRGVDHALLQRKHTLLDRHRTVVAPDAAARRSSTTSTVAAAAVATAGSPPHPATPSSSSTGEMQVDLPASVVQGVAGAAIPLIPGTYSYPFSVELPDTLPASREVSRSRDGRCVLHYRAIATLVLASGKTYSTDARFRIFPLPVQVQRWFQLHENEQLLASGAAPESDQSPPEAKGTDADSRFGVMSRLMSSAGTMRIGHGDREREGLHQRRLHHSWQFPEDQLVLEVAEFARTAEARVAEKQRRLNERRERSNNTSSSAAPPPVLAPPAAESLRRSPRKLRGHRGAEAAETRSLDGKDSAGAAAALDDDAGDEVYAFALEEGAPAAAAAASAAASTGDEGGEKDSGDAAAPVTPTDEADAPKPRHHRRHRHRSASEANNCSGSATGPSALLENNVEQLAYTPPEEELPQLPARAVLRPVERGSNRGDAAAPPRRNAADLGDDEDDRGDDVEESQDTQPHRRRSSHYHAPPWNQEFSIGLRGGFMRSGKVKTNVTLRSPLITVGSGKVCAKVLIDNTDGSGTITRVKYSLVTRCYIRTKTEVYSFEATNIETSSDVTVEKGKVVKLPEVELPVPKSTPLTMVTEGMGTTTFLIVRFYVGTTLKTFSRSVETEVVLVSGQDVLNCSRRLLRWTCFYRRGHGTDSSREITQRPPSINLSDKNAKPLVLDGNCSGSAMESVPLQDRGNDAASVSPSTVSHSLRLLRTSQRISKKAPSLDGRQLARTLNFEQAVFVPRNDDEVSGFTGHIDPMMGLNPFAAPVNDVGSSLPEDEEEEGEQSL